MDEMKAPEQNQALARIADLLRKVEQDSKPEFLPQSLNVMGLFADLLLPSARTVEKMSGAAGVEELALGQQFLRQVGLYLVEQTM